MQLGMIGLGRMGGNMVRRVMHAGHDCVAYDHSADAVRALTDEGAKGAFSLEELVGGLAAHRRSGPRQGKSAPSDHAGR